MLDYLANIYEWSVSRLIKCGCFPNVNRSQDGMRLGTVLGEDFEAGAANKIKYH